MLFSKRAILTVLAGGAILAVAGCGFQPIATSSKDAEALRLRSVSISDAPRRFEYTLEQSLFRIINEDPSAPNRLKVDVDLQERGLAIQQDDAITRINIVATAKYELLDLNGEKIDAGRLTSTTSLNATASQYATEVNRREAMKRLANDIANRLVTSLRIRGLQASSG
ncbi:MAG: LPS assembly lipoprotein LptE [Pseudomonadota bacterium]